ncbi:MAG: hypothetical protein H7A37_00630 [Chlamydiales bacterium]|nr:hypothetical protein [Chlamydiia bacterium]MCP5506797.1 hypothetical protein [Chlamydiales bacterium]
MPRFFLTFLVAILLTTSSYVSATVNGAFDVEGRAGGSSWSQWELGILDPNVGTPQNTANYSWQSGVFVPWQLNYNSSGNTLSFVWNVGSPQQTIIYGSALNYPFNSIKVFTETNNAWYLSSGDSVSVIDLVLQSGSTTQYGNDLIAQGQNDYQEFVFGTPISGSFTLTGKSALAWDGYKPKNNDMFFHITEATTVPAPEPSTYIILASFLLLAIYFRKRRLSTVKVCK